VTESGAGAVERFFVHLSARDWVALESVLAEGVERLGPFGDRITGRSGYVEFLRSLVPEDYGNDVHRITYGADGRHAFARVTEHLAYAEGTFDLEEAYAFELDERGAITRVEVYWQTPDRAAGGEAPDPAERSAGG